MRWSGQYSLHVVGANGIWCNLKPDSSEEGDGGSILDVGVGDDCFHSKFTERISHRFRNCFGGESLTPVVTAQPVVDLDRIQLPANSPAAVETARSNEFTRSGEFDSPATVSVLLKLPYPVNQPAPAMVDSGGIARIVAPNVGMEIELLVGTLEIVHLERTHPQPSGLQNVHDRTRFPWQSAQIT